MWPNSGRYGLVRNRQSPALVRFVDSFRPETPGLPGFEPANPQPTRRILTVSQLNRTVSDVLQGSFGMVWVAGEISNLSRPTSGHWYFTLKDANACVRAVMFRSAARTVRFQPREGDQVEVLARVSLYEARGDFQLGVEQMRTGGAGDLYQRFLRLKALLQAEGLFDAGRKRPIPPAPQVIGVVSPPQAAALRDVLTTLRRRAPQVPVIIYPASVQGASAAAELVRALQVANRRAECDVILLVRGGGSLQDLDAFNDERLARSIAASRLPVVSGVGHETDFTLADFVADERAPTPTAAAVLVSPDRVQSLQRLARAAQRLRRAILATTERGEQRLDIAARLLRSPAEQWREREQRLERAASRMERSMRQDVQRAHGRLLLASRSLRAPSIDLPGQRLATLRDALARAQRKRLEDAGQRVDRQAAALASYNPRAVLERGYAIVRDGHGAVVRAAGQVGAGDPLAVELAEGELRVRVDPGMGSAVG